MTSERDTALKPREDAGRATAENGVVVLDGPDGVAVTMTPDAAAQTADSLHAAAKAAREDPAGAGPTQGDLPDVDATDDATSS